MFKYHASQDTLSRAASVTLRLFLVAAVLLVSFPNASHTCQFLQNPISTTFNRQIANLAKWILRDYPISIITNLKPDSWCSEIWHLHLMKKELERMNDVAGEDLVAQLSSVQTEVHFLSSCSFTISTNCLNMEQTNASSFLHQLEHQIHVLRSKLRGQKVFDFSNCSQILCVPVLMPGSDSMMTAGPSQPEKDRGHHETHQASTASTTNTTLTSTTKMMGSRLRKTREETTDGFSRGSTAVQDSEGWGRRAHVWLGIPIFSLVVIALGLVCWRCQSAQREQNSVTLELQPLP